MLVSPGITGMVSGEGQLGSVDDAGREYARHADSQRGDTSTLKIVTFNNRGCTLFTLSVLITANGLVPMLITLWKQLLLINGLGPTLFNHAWCQITFARSNLQTLGLPHSPNPLMFVTY